MRAMGIAAINQFEMVEGVAVPNNLIANCGKYHATSGHHKAVELLQDIAGDDAIATLHGGGSMAAQKQAVLRSYDSFRAKNMAWRAAGIGE